LQFKKLQLAGFKTFADKTEIEFSEGMTAVVGPNGSGKSNVADALLWVMGEQNPRLLRGNDSRDVIFAGSDKRKPLGMAEVRLTIDNSDASLPIDFSEVTVTRRIYRSGESQYLLNGAPCRMKDIVDLFLDTGIGKGAYSFVSQSEIDSILSARPEDRRELFEEAAGIKKYRVRKKEAVRKLEQTEANLHRIRDIIHELEGQIPPLQQQAEIAERYLKLAERLQQIEVDLLVAEAKKQDYELFAIRQECDTDVTAISRMEAELGRLERESETAGSELDNAERELDAARNARQGAMTSLERTENQLELSKERARSSEELISRLDQEKNEVSARILALHHSIEQEKKEIEKAGLRDEEHKKALYETRARLKELESACDDMTRRNEDRQGALRRLAEQKTQREMALQACRTRITETEQRSNRELESCETLRKQIDEARLRFQAHQEQNINLQAQSASLRAEQSRLETERRALLDDQGNVSVALDSSRRLLAERSSRLATLAELQESGEGFFQGVRATLKAHRDGILKGRYAAVVDILTVPERLRVAIEVSLASSLQDIICDTESEAKEAIRWLKSTKAGRATFLALDMIRPGRSMEVKDLRGMKGLLGIASDHVQVESHYRDVLSLLLGRVVIAEDMDSAIQASRTLDGWHRIVTLEGELITPTGALTGGSLQGRGAQLVGRKGEIDDLKKTMPDLKKEVEDCSGQIADIRRKMENIESHIRKTSQELSSCLAAIAAEETAVKSQERDLQRMVSSLADVEAEQKRLDDAVGKLREEEAEWARLIEACLKEDISADDANNAEIEQGKKLSAERDAARAKAVALEVEAGRNAEKHAALMRSMKSNQHQLAVAEESRRLLQEQRESAASLLAEALSTNRDTLSQLEIARKGLSVLEERFATWSAEREKLLNKSFEKRNAIKELTKKRTETMQSMHDAELQIARMEVKISQTAQRLYDEYSITLEEALLREDPPHIEKDTVNEVARLRREVRQMGQVNTGAVEEFQRLTERHDFLSSQRADIEKAREALMATIAEIDNSTRDTFMQTFHGVSREFSRLFIRLFGGGSTRLVLTNPDDLLETGIEVIAQPPGKKSQSLSLLSGGERALTAVALLFSFLSLRPSPFVLLDEVDAPLDGSNVEKFVRMVSDFSERTQFLVITHNPTTMEAAPRWYGVTMQEPGISRILAYTVPADAIPSEGEEEILLQENLPI
jgi:chromosome segregation protein